MLGFGVYPDAKIEDVINYTTPEQYVLVMGVDNRERHDEARLLKAKGCRVVRRRFLDDKFDISQPVEYNVNLAYNLILGGLTPQEFNNIYDFTVGFNEEITNSNYEYHAELEYKLCLKLKSVNIKYSWGSIAVGNLDANIFIKFSKVLNIAYSTCYHLYLQPGNTTVENNNYFLKRPLDWYNACEINNINFPVLFGVESGTYYSWKNVLKISEDDYFNVQVLIEKEFDSWQIPKLGFCLFSIGCEGEIGKDWNIRDLSKYYSYNQSLITMQDNDIKDINAWVWYAGNLSKASSNVNSLIIKYSDGTSFGDKNNPTIFKDQFEQWQPSLKANNVKVYAYAYLYLDSPVQEAETISLAILQDHADGIVLDVEYEAINKLEAASIFFNTLYSLIDLDTYVAFAPDLRILTGNKFPNDLTVDFKTEPFPWNIFVTCCNAIMPQLYYTDFELSVKTTFKLLDVFKTAFPFSNIDIIPIIPANSSLGDLKLVVQECKNRNLNAVSIWRYDLFDNFSELKGLWFMFSTQELNVLGEQIFFKAAGIPFNPNAAITQAWINAYKNNNYLGRPRGLEFDTGEHIFQEFERGLCWALKSDFSKFGYDYPGV